MIGDGTYSKIALYFVVVVVRMDSIKQFMEQHEVPDTLQTRVKRWAHYAWSRYVPCQGKLLLASNSFLYEGWEFGGGHVKIQVFKITKIVRAL